MFKTRRQARYNTLDDSHFLPFECQALSRVSFKVPYMRKLIKERIDRYNAFIATGKTDRQFAIMIRKEYIDNKWRKSGDGWTQTVVFRMLKSKERAYKYKNPSYESPWEKKRKDWHGFTAKLDATYERYSKYPSGRTYGKKKPPVKLEYLPTGGARVID
jgi:cysteinyl-tRNA synthetase